MPSIPRSGKGSNGDHNVAMFCGALNQNDGGIEILSQLGRFIHSSCPTPQLGNRSKFPIRSATRMSAYGSKIDLIDEVDRLQSGDALLILTGRPRRQPKLANAELINAGHYAEALLYYIRICRSMNKRRSWPASGNRTTRLGKCRQRS